jgi:transcription antitermination factor NusG
LPNNAQSRSWFALRVKPRHEKAAERNLTSRGLEAFSPLYASRRAWSDRTQTVRLPLFPGYVFCRFERAQRFQVVTTPGVASIVGFAQQDTPVADEEIASIESVLSSGLPVAPGSYWREGDAIVIEHGPLAGARGVVVRQKNSCRLIVNVELLQRSVSVEVDHDLLAAPARTLGYPGPVSPDAYYGRL